MRKFWYAVVVLCLSLPAVPSGNAAAAVRPAQSAPALDAMLGAFARRPLPQAPVGARIGRGLRLPHSRVPAHHHFQEAGAMTAAAAAARSGRIGTYCTTA